eukprot:6192741-Pleurochrysis_carterae.AAC.3
MRIPICDSCTSAVFASAQGRAGLTQSTEQATKWFRVAAEQGHSDSAYNLLALCASRPGCVGGDEAQRNGWLREAADAGLDSAAFELGNALVQRDGAAALSFFLTAAAAGHAAAMYNAAHLLALGAAGEAPDLTLAITLFERAARHGEGKTVADAAVALAQLRPRWVQMAGAESDAAALSRHFDAAQPLSDEGGRDQGGRVEAGGDDGNGTVESRCVGAWRAAMRDWDAFERAYAQHASYENAEAIGHLRAAMASFGTMVDGGVCACGTGTGAPGAAAHALAAGELGAMRCANGSALGELRLHLVLSKLAEGSQARRTPDSLSLALSPSLSLSLSLSRSLPFPSRFFSFASLSLLRASALALVLAPALTSSSIVSRLAL